MWPNKPTAFIVIHGAGSHRPYETLDKFVRGFRHVLLEANPDLDLWWRHELRRHEGVISHFVSLAPDGKPRLDFHEYYWDCHADHKIALPEVIRWLSQVSESAKKFYRNKPQSAKIHQQRGSALFKDGDFEVGGYFIPLGGIGRVLGLLQHVGLARIPVLSTIVALLLSPVSRLLADLMGDLVTYSSADVRSDQFQVREKVLDGAVQELRLLLAMDDYEQIVLVGHSLGSVIAYDALNRIVMDINVQGGMCPQQAQKIAGLVTFGSPLDKVAFFFREHSPEDAYIQRQILAHTYGFKSRPFPGDRHRVTIANPLKHHLNRARWLNFYHLQDPVSGHLDAYGVDRNILCGAKVDGAAEAHTVYWTYDQMYEQISAEFLTGR